MVLNLRSVTHISILTFLSIVGTIEADAADLVIGVNTAATVSTANDAWDIDGSSGGNGATLTFDTNLDIDTQLTVTSLAGGNSNARLNTVTVNNDGNGDDTNTLVVGDGVNTVNLTIGGNVAGNFATDSADLAIVIDAADDVEETAANAMIDFQGSTVDLGTGSITLQQDLGTTATARFSGNVAQTVTGIITTNSAGSGTLSITNTHASGVTFNSAVGQTSIDQIIIGDTLVHTGSVASFNSTVDATVITIGTNGVGGGEGEDPVPTSSTANFYDTTTASGGFVFGDTLGDFSSDTNTARFVSGDHDYTVTGQFSAADDFDSNWIFVEATSTHQVTFANTIAGVHRIWFGNDEEATVTGEFQDNVTADEIMLGKVDGQTVTARFGSSGDMTVAGVIQKGGGNPTNNLIIYSTDNDLTHTVTFSDSITDIANITIGETALHKGGQGIFNDTVNTVALTITAADTNDNSTSTGDFNAAVTASGAITLTAGDNDREDTSASFADTVSAGSIVLNSDEIHGASATITVDGDAAQTITGTINGAAAGEGDIVVIDATDNAAPDADTFASAIGGTQRLHSVSVGSESKGGSALFSGAVSATTIQVIGGDHPNEDSSITLAGNITATSMVLNDAASGGQATMILGGTAAQTITGKIDGAQPDEGSLVITDTTANAAPDGDTFLSAIGGTARLRSIAIGTSTVAGKAIFSAGVSATSISVTSGNHADEDSTASFSYDVVGSIVLDDSFTDAIATVSFDGTSAQTLTGSMNAASAGEGRVIFNNDTTVSGNLGETLLDRITVAEGAALSIGTKGSTVALGAESIVVNGTLRPVDTLVLSTGSTLTFGDGSTIAITDRSVLGEGEAFIDARTHEATVAIGTGIDDVINVTVPGDFINGRIRLLDAGGNATYTKQGTFSVEPSDFVDYTVINEQDVVSVVATPRSASVFTEQFHTSEQRAEALRAGIIAATGDDAVTHAYYEALTAGGGEAAKAIEQSSNAPAALSASGTVGGNTVAAASNTILSHIADIRAGMGSVFAQGEHETGVAAGGMQSSGGQILWIKPFYNAISQKGTGTLAGYEADTSGVVAGVDLYQGEYIGLGIALSYAKTAIEGKGLGEDQTDVANYQFTAYGSYTMPSWYLDVLAGYGMNDSETERYINFGGLNRLASGEYTGKQYVLKADGGVPLEVAHDMFLTPLAGLHYVYLSNEDYIETGAGVLDLRVDTNDLDIVQSSLGMRFHTIVPSDTGKYIPYVQLGAAYEFMGNEVQTTSSYANGGAAFKVVGHKGQQWTKNAGAGITYELEGLSFVMEYQAEFQHNYVNSTASVGTRFAF